MENTISSLKISVQCQEADYQGNYRISNLMSKLSDLATINALQIGIWNNNLSEKYGFVLTKETIILKRPIKINELIKFYTRASGYKRIQFTRNYWVEDVHGEEIASIYSLWTLIDLKKRRIIKPEKAGIVMPEIIPYNYNINNYNEIHDDVELSYIMERTVLYSDIDVNQHLNNSRYFEWAFDVLPIEFFEEKYFKEISVIFKKEMSPNTTAKIYRYISNDYVKIVFKSTDDKVTYFEFGGYTNSI
ncbi:acyl-[acyl-carrier-protein] thioesterase [Thomasclavelia sp.]